MTLVIEISELSKEQKALLDRIGLLLSDLGMDLTKAAKAGKLLKNDVWAIRTTMDVLDEVFDEMNDEEQALFEFLQDGPTSKLKKV